MLEYITLPDNILPPPAPYSHAVRAGDFLFVTGQLAENPITGEKVVMARIFLTDCRDYQVFNEIYASYFTESRRPSRTTVGVLGFAN